MKFGVEVAVTKLFATHYVVEADNEDDARREVEDLLDDPVFTDTVDQMAYVCACDDEYVVSDVFEVDNEIEAGSFFRF